MMPNAAQPRRIVVPGRLYFSYPGFSLGEEPRIKGYMESLTDPIKNEPPQKGDERFLWIETGKRVASKVEENCIEELFNKFGVDHGWQWRLAGHEDAAPQSVLSPEDNEDPDTKPAYVNGFYLIGKFTPVMASA